jgi:hypothetical protein
MFAVQYWVLLFFLTTAIATATLTTTTTTTITVIHQLCFFRDIQRTNVQYVLLRKL